MHIYMYVYMYMSKRMRENWEGLERAGHPIAC